MSSDSGRAGQGQDLVTRAFEIYNAHTLALADTPKVYPVAGVKCKCGASMEAISFEALQHCFAIHMIVMALTAGDSAPAAAQPRALEGLDTRRDAAAEVLLCRSNLQILRNGIGPNLQYDSAKTLLNHELERLSRLEAALRQGQREVPMWDCDDCGEKRVNTGHICPQADAPPLDEVRLFDLVADTREKLRPYLRIETFPTGGTPANWLAVDIILQAAFETALAARGSNGEAECEWCDGLAIMCAACIEKRDGELRRLREALEWYAMRDWALLLRDEVDSAMRRDGHDMGEKARKALAPATPTAPEGEKHG